MKWQRLVLLELISTGCTKPNPRSCLDGLCTDPAFPFCDTDGSLEGQPDVCIPVDCTPMEFVACRDNSQITCNTTGNGLDVTQCEDQCDASSGCSVTRTPFIVFSSDRDGNSEIYRMNLDGSLQTNLTLNPSNDDSPLWDPTGDRIAFSSNRDGPIQLYTMAADGTNVVNVSQGDAIFSAWSPDGSRLLFTSSRTGSSELYSVHADGSMLIPLTNLGGVGSGDWSPDGTRIAFDSNTRIHVMDSDGSNPLPISAGVDGFPRWRPDGSKIAFSRRITLANNDVFVANPDGSSPVNITNTTSATEFGPLSWSPDGALITGKGGNDPDTEVFVVDAAGTSLQNVSNSPSSRDGNPCWSADGMSLVYGSDRGGNYDLYRVPRAGGNSVNLTNSTGTDDSCSIRPR